MKKIICLNLCLFFFISLQTAVFADDSEEVYNLIKTNINKVLVLLNDKALDKEVKLNQIMDIVSPLFDFPLMAKLTLGRTYWPQLNDAQKKEFTDLFIVQLQNSYYDKLNLFSDETLTFGTPVPEKNKFYMQVDIITKDEPVKMLYKLYKRDNTWKIYDLEVQDISLVKSYSTQYSQILQESNVSKLLEEMKSKINEQQGTTT